MAEMPEPIAEKKRGRPFEKGTVPNPDGRRGKDKPEVDDGLVDGARMRRVYGQPASQDQNSAQRRLRKLFDKDVKGYIQLMTQLEEKELAAAQDREGTEGPVAPPISPDREPDEGEAAMRAAGEEFLRWLRERNAEEGIGPR